MDRRQFLKARSKKEDLAPKKTFRINSDLTPYAGAWSSNELQHLLKRCLFGSSKTDLSYFANKSLDDVVAELLNPTAPLPAPPVNDYNSSTVNDPAVAAGQTWINNPVNDGTINSVRRSSFKKWWAGVMINQDRSIREKLTLFWANHFGTETNDIGNAHYIYNHHNLLRKNALGNFRQLIKAVTIDAGMLRYLNGYLNTAAAPDENYGRELQELFTLGKGPAVKYTEDDVKTAARVLTGWRINGNTFDVFFDGSKHDATPKQFSSFYDGAAIAGRTGAAGANETDDLIAMIFKKEEVARFICRKLYRWFVYYSIDDTTETNIIQPLAQLFISGNFEIKPVLEALLKSQHFFDLRNQGCLIKSPVDHVISCIREFNVSIPANYADAYAFWNYLRNWITSMSQDIGDPPNVSGWPAYYQAPLFHELWINSDTLPKRNRFTDTLITTGYSRNGKTLIIDAVGFTKTFVNPGDPNALLNEALNILYRVPLSAPTKQTIKQQILLSNQTADYYWTDAWNTYINNPGNATYYNIVNTRLKSLYQYLMSQAEYQLS